MLRFQGHLPINPTAAPDMPWVTALHTAASFVTNTNQQFYAGESAVSALTQTAGLLVQNVLSAATGIAFAFAFIRAVAQRCTREAAQENAPVTVGNPLAGPAAHRPLGAAPLWACSSGWASW